MGNEEQYQDDRLDSMRRLNIEQRRFYESRYVAKASSEGRVGEQAANVVTNIWTTLRRKIQDARDKIGITAERRALHMSWINNESPDCILDLGCFDGNDLSLWMAERADRYIGIDLSTAAINSLSRKLRQNNLQQADARAVDFLEADFGRNAFDLVYAKSVLHHFEFLEPVLEKVRYILKPGGVVISTDPLKTEPINRLARRMYRPFQTDSQWEWPFSKATVSLLDQYFSLEETRGFLGASKFAFPFFFVPFAEGVGRRIGQMGHELDRARASRRGSYLFNMCWQVSFLMRSRKVRSDADIEAFE